MDDDRDRRRTRHAAYAFLILVSLGVMIGGIMTARARDGHTPFFSANDRSRWSTISSLVDHGTYRIDTVRERPGWKSIDMVRHLGRDGRPHYFSSKPPLYPTLIAGQYALIRAATGATIEAHPFAIARVILVITNVLPMALFLVLIAVWAERQGTTDFGRIFVVACAGLGTCLTPFATTLNNHTPAAIGTLVLMLCIQRIWRHDDPPAWLFALSGLSAGYAAANELPALSFAALAAATLFWLSPRKTLLWFVPAAGLVAVGFFAANYAAHASWRPPYAHRQPGDNWYDYPGSYWYGSRQGVDLGEPSRLTYLFHMLVGHHGFFSLTPIWLISLVGIVRGVRRDDIRWRYLCVVTIVLFVVCVTYYAGLRPQRDRNYGGVTCAFRWLFWQIPLWLMVMVPSADGLSKTGLRRSIAIGLLAFSAISVVVALSNPWTHPWLYVE